MKKFIFLVLGVIILAVVLVIGLRGLTGEDSWICQNGQWVQHGYPSAPKPTTGCGLIPTPEVSNQPNIIITSPTANEEIGSPVVVAGQARVFENQFQIRIKDDSGKILADVSAYASASDVGQFGPFENTVKYFKPTTLTGVIEAFDLSAKDGSEIDKVSVPVKFRDVDTMSVSVYFSNSVKDPNSLNCDKTYPVQRTIAKTNTPARAALEELLSGPTAADLKAGYVTQINQGVKINSLTIINGVAKADFDETLEKFVGGSCRGLFIRSQITNTLQQFPSVKSVIISIDGRTGDVILQP